jgi:hypothetical protein
MAVDYKVGSAKAPLASVFAWLGELKAESLEG